MACVDIPPIGQGEKGVLTWDGERLVWISPSAEGQVLVLGQNGLTFVNPQAVCNAPDPPPPPGAPADQNRPNGKKPKSKK